MSTAFEELNFEVGEEVIFGSKRFTLIQRQFTNGVPMWLACETHGTSHERLLIETDLCKIAE